MRLSACKYRALGMTITTLAYISIRLCMLGQTEALRCTGLATKGGQTCI